MQTRFIDDKGSQFYEFALINQSLRTNCQQPLNHLQGQSIFADKAYQRENKPVFSQGSEVLHTPVKKQKGQTYLEAADQLLSKAVSSIRQPIESFFNCLEEKTHIQMASKVRSYHGLMVHVFGRIAAAFFILSNALCS